MLEYVEDVLLDRRDDATERLLEFAETVTGDKKDKKSSKNEWRKLELQERISFVQLTVKTNLLKKMLNKREELVDKPIMVIEGHLMKGMNIVGDLFGAGKIPKL